jgi:transposase
MTKSQTVLRRKDTTSGSALYISFDLGDKSWQISLGDDRFHVSRHTVAAGDTAAVAAHMRCPRPRHGPRPPITS